MNVGLLLPQFDENSGWISLAYFSYKKDDLIKGFNYNTCNSTGPSKAHIQSGKYQKLIIIRYYSKYA